MRKNYKTIILLVSLTILLIVYFINSEYIIKCFLEYNKLFYTKLFPVSFIFFIFSTILIELESMESPPLKIIFNPQLSKHIHRLKPYLLQ